MKKTQILAALAAGLIGSSAHALDAWEGSKFIYSTDSRSSYALKVDLDTKGNAKIATSFDGAGEGTFSQTGETIKINLTSSIDSIGFPVKNNPRTGAPEQVQTTSSLKEILLEGYEDEVYVTEKGTDCSLFRMNDGSEEEVCSDYTNKNEIAGAMLLRSLLKPVSASISAGDKVVIPLDSFNDAYVQIDGNGKATPVDADAEVNGQVKSVEKINDQVKVTLTDGGTILFGQTRMIEGHGRVLGVQNKDGKETLITGLIVVDQNVDVNSFSPSGTYKAIMAGGSSNIEDLEYQFNPDGFGGFETQYAGEVMFNPWSWKFEDMELHASRYRRYDEPSHVDTVDGVKECIAGGKELCYVYNKRSYKVIAKDGNKFTMLRKMTFDTNQPDVTPAVQQSVWVMYKK